MAPTKAPEKKSPKDGSGPPATRIVNSSRSPLPQEDIEALPGAVTNFQSAEKYLASVLLRQADEPLTLLHLAGVLFQTTQMTKSIPISVTNAIRAVAFILKRQAASEIAEVVAELAAKHLSEALSSSIVNSVVAAIAPQVAAVHSTAENLRDTLEKSEKLCDSIERGKEEKKNDFQIAAERIEEAVDTLYESIEDCNNSYKILTPSLEFTQDRLNNISTQLLQRPPSTQTSPMPQPTYSSIAASNLPPSFDKAAARAALRAKQILIDPTPGHSLFPPDATNAVIAKRLSDALIEICSSDTPTGSVRSIQRLRNGGLIVELDNEQLAGWLKGPTGRILLETHLDSSASIRDRTYSVVVQFLLVSYEIEREDFPRLIERENHLQPNAIASIRWIKPPQRRSKGQRTAFALLQVKDAVTANHILKEGICIDAHRYAVNKDKKEPLRCAKCQKFGHMARNCSSPHDICGTCGGRHWTTQCNSFRTECCANCKSQTHTSWSRKCPEFIRRCKDLDDAYPENKMPFFPADSLWTLATHPPRPSTPLTTHHPIPTPSQSVIPSTPTPPPPTKQSTLNFQPIPQTRLSPPTTPSTPSTPSTTPLASPSTYSTPSADPLSSPSNV